LGKMTHQQCALGNLVEAGDVSLCKSICKHHSHIHLGSTYVDLNIV
jgi:hypothetical protein